MKTWILCVSGFTETIGEHTGTAALWMKMRRYSTEETCVKLFEWDENWKKKAAFIAEHSEPDVRILVCAYSWGAGHGFIKLARYLQEYDICIETAVLCDPVYRSRLISTRWLALVPGMKIKIPANVENVYWLYQTTDKPRGHKPVAEMRVSDDNPAGPLEPATCIFAGTLVSETTHGEIDESPQYHRIALRQAALLQNNQNQ